MNTRYDKMKYQAPFLLFAALFIIGCDMNETTITVDDTPNRIVEVNYTPVKEGAEGRIQMEIIMELNTIYPAYPQIGTGINAEKLQLSLVRHEIGEGFYRGIFTFVPNEAVSVLKMEDFTWTPHIEFSPVILPTSLEQIKAE